MFLKYENVSSCNIITSIRSFGLESLVGRKKCNIIIVALSNIAGIAVCTTVLSEYHYFYVRIIDGNNVQNTYTQSIIKKKQKKHCVTFI